MLHLLADTSPHRPPRAHPHLTVIPVSTPAVRMSWQSQLERLAQPADLSGQEMQSSRWRAQQQQQHQHSAAAATSATSAAAAGRPAPAAVAHSSANRSPTHSPGASDLQACEVCTLRSALVYCSTCDRLLCVDCDARTHASSPLQLHPRGPYAQVDAHRVPCPEAHPPPLAHGRHAHAPAADPALRIRLYCRSCARPVCSTCRAPGGAHSDSDAYGQRHECVTLAEQWQRELRALRTAVGSIHALHDVKQRMMGELRSLSDGTNELSKVCSSVEAVEVAASQQVLSRLDNVAELNEIKIQQAVQRVESDIESIDSFLRATAVVPVPTGDSADGASVASAAAAASAVPAAPVTPAAMCRFLRSAHRHQSDGARLGALPSSSGGPAGAAASLSLSPLPRESSLRAQRLSQFPRLLALLQVKDELVRFAMASRKGLLGEQQRHAQNLQRLYADSQAEMESWMQLSQRLHDELRAFKYVCCFCGASLAGDAASTPCAANSRAQTSASGSAPLDAHGRREGDGMHYFVTAS